MTVTCSAPEGMTGVAIRLASYMDCQSRALGENGFQALVGSPATTALLSATVTIFIALIGYRLLLGSLPTLAEGVGWAVRLGVVLTLVTSWPAFQTLIYRTVLDTPAELASLILPAVGLPSTNLEGRVQDAYDRMRMGSQGGSAGAATPAGGANSGVATPGPAGLVPLPHAASLFVVSAIGLGAALRFASGLLLAIAPLAALCLLFEATFGIFESWLRALAAASLGTLAAMVITSLQLVLIEAELSSLMMAQADLSEATANDTQGVVTLVLAFALVTPVAVLAVVRMVGAIRLPRISRPLDRSTHQDSASVPLLPREVSRNVEQRSLGVAPIESRSRAMMVSEALSSAAYREAGRDISMVAVSGRSAGSPSRIGQDGMVSSQRLGMAGRRTASRQTRSARRRDAAS